MLSAIAGRLLQFVTVVASDPVYRRLLRYRPEEALASAGFFAGRVPNQLPVQHYGVSVYLDDVTLFGNQEVANEGPECNPPLEARLVAYGFRPLALIHGSERELTRLALWARRRNLFAILSPKEFTPKADPDKAGYSNLSTVLRPARAGSGAWRGLLIGADPQQPMLGWLSLLFGWDAFLGLLLGYPSCCVSAFERNWPGIRDDHAGDGAAFLAFSLPDYAGCEPFHWGANIFARYTGIELNSHFPCRLDCEASEKLAETVSSALSMWEPEHVAYLRDWLTAPVLFSEKDGVFVLHQATISESAGKLICKYDPGRLLATTQSTTLARALLATTEFETSGAGVKIAGSPIPGYLLRFAASAGQRRVRRVTEKPNEIFQYAVS